MLPFLLAMMIAALQAGAGVIPVLTLDGGVDPGSADYLVSGIEQAEADGADAVIIVMDTPGGLLSSTREIVQAQLGAAVPVVVYISPSGARAGSAGVFITMAAHVAVMAPGTTIGAAHPVDLLGGGIGPKGEDEEEGAGDEVMQEKILNDTLAWSRAIAEQRGRSIEFAEAAVRTSESITDSEALEQNVVDLVVADLATLVEQLDGRVVQTSSGEVTLNTSGSSLSHKGMDLRQRVMHFLGDPNVIFVLLGLGLLGLYIEYHNPGLIVPGVLGACFLISVAVALSIVPFNVGGLILVVVGFALFALEVWIPSYGALTIGGVLCLVLGGILLFNVQEFDLRVQLSTLITVAVLAGLLALGVGTLVLRSHKRKVATGSEGLMGDEGEVTEGGSGKGWVVVDGAIWKAAWSGELQAGTAVRVVAVKRLVLHVEPLSSVLTNEPPTEQA